MLKKTGNIDIAFKRGPTSLDVPTVGKPRLGIRLDPGVLTTSRLQARPGKTRRVRVECHTVQGMELYHKATLYRNQPNVAHPTGLYFRKGEYRTRLVVDESVDVSSLKKGRYYTIETISDLPRKKRKRK